MSISGKSNSFFSDFKFLATQRISASEFKCPRKTGMADSLLWLSKRCYLIYYISFLSNKKYTKVVGREGINIAGIYFTNVHHKCSLKDLSWEGKANRDHNCSYLEMRGPQRQKKKRSGLDILISHRRREKDIRF